MSLLVKTFANAFIWDMMWTKSRVAKILTRRMIENGAPRTGNKVAHYSQDPNVLVPISIYTALSFEAHMSSLGVIGSTADSVARLLQDREIELWEGRWVVASASEEEVAPRFTPRSM